MARSQDVTSRDGTRIATYRWEPAGPIKADVLLCHGLAEHMGRYEHIAAALTAKGWRVTGVELRGHGQSDGKRGHVDRWTDYVDDLRAAAALIGGPYAILAHSMGGLVALEHLRTAKDVTAAALCAPAVGAGVPIPAWKLGGSRLLNRLVPRLSMSNEIPPEWICSYEPVVAAYKADPLVYGTITPRWFIEMNRTIAACFEHAPDYSTPMFLFWGTGDRIVSQDALQRFATAAHAPHRAWPDLFHECMNEANRDEVLAVATSWLAEHLPSA